MKSSISLAVLFLIGMVQIKAQKEFMRYVNYSLYFGHPDANEIPYKETPYSIILTYKDELDTELYEEAHGGTTDSKGFVFLHIGGGDPNPNNPYGLLTLDFHSVYKVCYKAELTTDEGIITIMDEQLITAAPRAIVAENATNADYSLNAQNAMALGEYAYSSTPFPVHDILLSDFMDIYGVLLSRKPPEGKPDPGTIQNIYADQFFSINQAPTEVNGNTLDYVSLGLGNPRPIVFSKMPVTTLENYFTLCPQDPENFYNGFGVKMPEHRSSVNHATAAIYAENVLSPMGVGLFSNGRSRGSYNQGQTGALGICNNTTGNGAAIWGYIGFEPADGNANYALLASTNGFPNTYAAYLQGNVLYTGTLTGPSDRTLKTETRQTSHGLNEVLLLRPTTFRYRDDAPYSLPGGTHHGFIAQEVEEILPELVSEIPLIANAGLDQSTPGDIKNFKGLNYMEFIPVLTKAIQELNAKVDAQAKEIEELKVALHAKTNPK